MSKYIVKKENGTRKIVKIEAEKYYTFSPKGNVSKMVKTVTVYDEEKIKKILIKKLMIKYQRLLNIINDIISSDDSSSSDFMICLDEISKLKDILEYKYKKFLKRELYSAFLEDLNNLSNYVNDYIEMNVSKGR